MLCESERNLRLGVAAAAGDGDAVCCCCWCWCCCWVCEARKWIESTDNMQNVNVCCHWVENVGWIPNQTLINSRRPPTVSNGWWAGKWQGTQRERGAESSIYRSKHDAGLCTRSQSGSQSVSQSLGLCFHMLRNSNTHTHTHTQAHRHVYEACNFVYREWMKWKELARLNLKCKHVCSTTTGCHPYSIHAWQASQSRSPSPSQSPFLSCPHPLAICPLAYFSWLCQRRSWSCALFWFVYSSNSLNCGQKETENRRELKKMNAKNEWKTESMNSKRASCMLRGETCHTPHGAQPPSGAQRQIFKPNQHEKKPMVRRGVSKIETEWKRTCPSRVQQHDVPRPAAYSALIGPV